jgi:hypothetical protein
VSTKPRVYLETTIVSYLTASASPDDIKAGHQRVTREWWNRRSRFELFVSETVLTEVERGDPSASARRLAALEGIPVLTVTAEADDLATKLVAAHAMPPEAAVDAMHVAVAVINGIDYVLTWNCAHIANAAMRGRIERTIREAGYEAPVLCTPEELME